MPSLLFRGSRPGHFRGFGRRMPTSSLFSRSDEPEPGGPLSVTPSLYCHEQRFLVRDILQRIGFLKDCRLFFKLAKRVIALGDIVMCFL